MSDVVLCECFARDGLQHEAEFVPTETQARADRALRRARLPARRGDVLLQSQGGAAVRRRERAARSRCRAARACTTRRPAPTCARSSARSPISTPASASTRSACWSRRAKRIRRRTCASRAPTNGTTCAAWRRRRRAASA